MYDTQSGITFGDALKKLRINDEFWRCSKIMMQLVMQSNDFS
jgi:hypothetical protein